MPAFRILSQSPVYFLLDGVTPAAGGRIEFYEAGTTTAKDVYGDKALTVNNGSSIALGSDGRTTVDVWGDGSYRVRGYAADDTEIFDRDNVEIPGGAGQVLPTLADGQFISALGGVLVAADVLQPPDPTGQSGKIIGSDGSGFLWQDPPADPVVPITVGTSSAQIGDTDSKAYYVEWGTATAPASGTYTASKAITFAKTFASAPFVSITPIGALASGPLVAYPTSTPTTGGFTAGFDVAEGTNAQATINSDISFLWKAEGLVNVA
ncbi:hypothetical protein [Frateuria sp.]|uniref:hypothetical protein n=1 Tax=Frateuria sp. TaxID=2211372 RepID=UPI003F81AE22